MKFIFYHHKNKSLARYVEHYAALNELVPGSKSVIASLPQQAVEKAWSELPTRLRRLLFFARPDVVICLDDGVKPVHPVFAFEITRHVPARDHWMQRFVNLVGCAQERVPGAYIMPFNMENHPRFPSKIDSVFFFAYDRITEIHQTPIFIAEWETPDGMTLIGDTKFASEPDHNMPDMLRGFGFLRAAVEGAVHGRPVQHLMRERSIIELRDRIRQKAYSGSLPQVKDFRRLSFCMPDNRFLNTSEFKSWLTKNGVTILGTLPDRIVKRNKYLIFTPQIDQRGKSKEALRAALLKRIDQKGGDPYLGQPLAFDYLFCRLGESPYERDCNVVVNLMDLRFSDFAHYHRKVWEASPLQYTKPSQIKHIPTYTMHLKEGSTEVMKNFIKVYAFASDIIVFSDGMIYF